MEFKTGTWPLNRRANERPEEMCLQAVEGEDIRRSPGLHARHVISHDSKVPIYRRLILTF
ncbi:hypothetical protein EYF80_017166 [Liparis tanakae]|uniref:Uncharacterized protein n=1 Tax=Liparis tanakae TaxID=230148 RepID=A0A4Z2I3C0_9TELE|nr:hypothetical protein EYF80_017166 [Liparis tanakae]